MDDEYIADRSDNPFRHPLWRWQRALAIVQSDRTQSHTDRRIKGAIEFLKAEQASAPLPRRLKSIAQAVQLWRGRPEQRWTVESYLLTLPMAEVARRCCLPLATVAAFEALFFCVTDRLIHRDWIEVKAIHRREPDGSLNGLAVACRAFGYHAGLRAAEIVLAVVTHSPLPAWVFPPNDPQPGVTEGRLRAICRLTILAMQARTPDQLLRTIRLADELEREYGSTGMADRAREMLAVHRDMLKLARRNGRRRGKSRPVATTHSSASAIGPFGSSAFSGAGDSHG
jgi:hypothetical protein